MTAVSVLNADLADRVTLPDLRVQTVLKELPLPPPGHMSLPSFYVHMVDDSKLYEWFGVDDTRQTGALPGLWSFVSEFVPDSFGENHVALELTTRNFALNFHLFELTARDIHLNPRVEAHSSRGLVTSVQYGHRCALSVNTTVLLPDTEVSADFAELSRVVQEGVTSLLHQRNEFLQHFEERFPYTRFNAKVTCSEFMPIIRGEDIFVDDEEDQVREEYEDDEEVVFQKVRKVSWHISNVLIWNRVLAEKLATEFWKMIWCCKMSTRLV